ncbi:hypothetical protein [Tropicimonas sp.]
MNLARWIIVLGFAALLAGAGYLSWKGVWGASSNVVSVRSASHGAARVK